MCQFSDQRYITNKLMNNQMHGQDVFRHLYIDHSVDSSEGIAASLKTETIQWKLYRPDVATDIPVEVKSTRSAFLQRYREKYVKGKGQNEVSLFTVN